MTISDRGLLFIHGLEGLRLIAYADPVGVLTIGYGHTGHDVRRGQSIDEATANELLELDLLPAEYMLASHFRWLDQNEFDALCSFCLNVGLGAFLASTMRKHLDATDVGAANAQFQRWDKATLPTGQIVTLPGLTRRRLAEARLFWTGDYGDSVPA